MNNTTVDDNGVVRAGIRARGRRGFTVVPNWRWEDTELDPYALRVAGWIASHADSYVFDYVTRNAIAKRTGVSQGKVTSVLARLETLGIIEVATVDIPQSQGGRRLVITFDFDVWEGGDPGHVVTGARSCGDQGPGHVVTATTGDIEEEDQRRTITSPSATERFPSFWTTYPRKVGKPAAERAFKAAVKRSGLTPIQHGFIRWRDFWDDNQIPEQFIPHPATWLNQERYNDKPPAGAADALTAAQTLYAKYAAEEGTS